MGIIDIPGERFNLAGKEATFSLSYLCVILEMTIATRRGGGHGAGVLPESDAAGPRWTPVRGASPPAVPAPAWLPRDGSRRTLHRPDPGSQPQCHVPTPPRAPGAMGCRSFSCGGARGGWKELFQPLPSSSTVSLRGQAGLWLGPWRRALAGAEVPCVT